MADPTPITDPQSQSGDPLPDANFHTVDNVPVTAGDDNQRILARQTPTGVSRGVQQLGGPSLTADSGNNQIIVNPGIPNVLMGDQPTFGEGFYVSKPGIDVIAAKSNDDFIFNSNQNVFKIIQTGTISLPTANFVSLANSYSSGANFAFPISVRVPHGLNTIPAVLGYVSFGYVPLPWTFNGGNGSNYYVMFTVRVATDSVNVYGIVEAFGYNSPAFGVDGIPFPAMDIKYYLLQETAN